MHSQDRRGVYEVVIEPWITLASRTSDFKIFQNKSALDIVREVLGEFGRVYRVLCKRGWDQSLGILPSN